MSPPRRIIGLLGLVLGVVTGFAIVVPVVAAGDRLPARLATHWGTDGSANGSMSAASFVAFGLAFGLGPILVGVPVAMRKSTDRLLAVLAAGLAAMFAVLFALISGQTVLSNLDATDWRLAASPSALSIVVTVGLSLVAAAGASAAAARVLPPLPSTAPNVPTLMLEVGERAVWVGSCSNRWLYAPSFGLVVVGVVAITSRAWWYGVGLLAVGLMTTVLARITVVVDRRGVKVAYGVAGWPTTTIGLDRIERAEVLDVRPSRWGGWGYRGALHIFRQAAVVLRAGPGIRLDLVDGKVFVVTVDDPSTGAALVNGLLADRDRPDRSPPSPHR